MSLENAHIRYKQARKSLGLSINDLANELGYSRNTVAKNEKEPSQDIRYYEYLAELAGVDLVYLMHGNVEASVVESALRDIAAQLNELISRKIAMIKPQN